MEVVSKIIELRKKKGLKDLVSDAVKKRDSNYENEKSGIRLEQYEAAKFLGVTIQTLIRWKKENLIPYYQVGKRIFYIKSELLDALRKNPKLNK